MMHNNAKTRLCIGRRAFLSAMPTFVAFPSPGCTDDLDLHKLFHQSIPESPFIGVVYRYADAMLQYGRDTFGPQKTGMLLSALDRKTLKPLGTRPHVPTGVSRRNHRDAAGKSFVGSNLQMDQNLLRLLYFLKGLSGEDRYPQAADAALKWFLQNAQSPKTGLLPWGEHLSWDVMNDRVLYGADKPQHELSRPWMLWDKCFQLAPNESKRFALGLWNNHVVNQKTGELSGSAEFHRLGSPTAADCPRQAGFFLRTWAEAYFHTNVKTFLEAIEVVLNGYDKKLRVAAQELRRRSGSGDLFEWLSMAIDCDGAARKVPEPLRSPLTAFAARVDTMLWSLPHELKEKKGFVNSFRRDSSDPHIRYTPRWDPEGGRYSTAAVGVMCMSRYQNTGRVAFRKLIVDAAEAYLDSLPNDDMEAWPLHFGQAITVELAAFRITAQQQFKSRAFELGEIAVEKFFGDSPLPRASHKTDHYEHTTGADTLVLALAELHLSTRTITVVRTPANTIDR